MQLPLLRLLGTLALDAPGPGGGPRLGRKGEALLAVVALQGTSGVARDKLTALLWPELNDHDARNALRQALHKLRRASGLAFGDAAVDGERLALDRRSCDVDVQQFEALAGSEDLRAMVAAADLYRGDFAEGLHAGADFELWAAVERERLRGLAQGLLERLSEVGDMDRAGAAATALARRLLAADPLHEGSWCALVRVCMRLGWRAKAVQVWAQCRQALESELGVEPSARTVRTVQRLLADGQWHPPGEPGRESAPTLAEVTVQRCGLPTLDQPPGTGLDLMLHGWQQFCLFTREGNRRARDAFAALAALHADHEEALALVGFTHFFDAVGGWTADPAASLQTASRWADRSMACHRGRARPLQLRAKLLLWERRHDDALELLRSAVALEPGSAYAHFHLGEAAMWCGHSDQALATVSRALHLDANDHGIFLTVRATALWLAGDLEAARAAAASALARNPDYAWALAAQAAILAELGQLAAAREAAAAACRTNRRLCTGFAERHMPYRQAAHGQRLARAWQLAGMPRDERPAEGSPPARCGPPGRLAGQSAIGPEGL